MSFILMEKTMDNRGTIEEIRRRILGVFPNARRVVLFGSRAFGKSLPDSDFDIMVVAATGLSPAKRVAKLRSSLIGMGYAFDLLVVTPAEYDHLKDWKSTAVSWADKQGTVIHEDEAA
jgi:predicted nucleotidyltransferase